MYSDRKQCQKSLTTAGGCEGESDLIGSARGGLGGLASMSTGSCFEKNCRGLITFGGNG